jgi:hypothetical protein
MDGVPPIEPAPQAPPPEPAESTLGRELLGGLLGVAVALGCVLPPLVHLVSGPLGPFIGGFVASNFVKPGMRGRAVIGVTIGSGLAALGAAIATAIISFGGSSAPSWFPSKDTIGLILVGVWVYGSALGTAGAAVSRAWANKDTR